MRYITAKEAHVLAENFPDEKDLFIQSIMDDIKERAEEGSFSTSVEVTNSGIYNDIGSVVDRLESCGFKVNQKESDQGYVYLYLNISW